MADRGAEPEEGGARGDAAPASGERGIWPRVRSALGRVRRWPERMLHPWRRRRARRRLREDPPPAHVLFVCHGNICRSPYAERAFRRRTGGRVQADSAGFFGPGRESPPVARRVAAERGFGLDDHVSKLVDGPTLSGVDLVVVMEPPQASTLRRGHGVHGALVLGDLDPGRPGRRTIRDPVMQPPATFREVYARIDRCLHELMAAAGLPAGRPDPEPPSDPAPRRSRSRDGVRSDSRTRARGTQ